MKRPTWQVFFLLWMAMMGAIAFGQGLLAGVLGLVLTGALFTWAIGSHLADKRRERRLASGTAQ